MAELEREIAKTERRLGDIDEELARPEVYRDHTRSVPLADEKAKLKEHHATYMQQWERHAAAVEG